MYAEKNRQEEIAIHAITEEEAVLIQTAVLRLSEQAQTRQHALMLRRLAMDLDKLLPAKFLQRNE